MRLQHVAASLVVALASTSVIIGRQLPPAAQSGPTSTGLILGRIVDADSGTPVPGVIVTLAGGGPELVSSAALPPRRVLVDGQGRFVFRGLQRGSYTLLATMGGNGFSPSGFLVTGSGHQIGAYLNGGYGQRRPNGPTDVVELGEGERIADAVIRLWKGGAIDGTVFDEAGEPLVGMLVSAVRRSTDGRLLTGPTTKTDDRGAYHLDTLAPGDYLIIVPQTQVLMPLATIESVLADPSDAGLVARFLNAGAPSPRVIGVRVGSSVVSSTGLPNLTTALAPAGRADGPYVYQTTFYPTTIAASNATTITLRSGEERAASMCISRP